MDRRMFGPLDGMVAIVWDHRIQLSLALILSILWSIAEYLGRHSTWTQGAPKRPPSGMDRGTYPIIGVALGGSLVANALLLFTPLGETLPFSVELAGAVVLGIGLVLRGWAMRTLGRFFTMPITIRPDHNIVSSGPYRWVRHPAYTGNFLMGVGMALLLGSAVGVLLTLVVCLAAYVYRIQIEEAALVGRFGERYQDYARRTSRLIPGLY
jgi:protein-S-isoprenylcysteine O-methyltransferase Ste14